MAFGAIFAPLRGILIYRLALHVPLHESVALRDRVAFKLSNGFALFLGDNNFVSRNMRGFEVRSRLQNGHRALVRCNYLHVP